MPAHLTEGLLHVPDHLKHLPEQHRAAWAELSDRDRALVTREALERWTRSLRRCRPRRMPRRGGDAGWARCTGEPLRGV
jgi:hypothetical protein